MLSGALSFFPLILKIIKPIATQNKAKEINTLVPQSSCLINVLIVLLKNALNIIFSIHDILLLFL